MTLPRGAVCDIPDESCCNVVYDVAEHLLAQVYDALSNCYDGDCDKPQAYITVGFGDDGIQDALTVAIQQVTPSPATGTGRGGVSMYMGLYRCTYEIRLRESGWPMVQVEGNTIVTPDPERQNALARHLFSHGEMMYRKIHQLHNAFNLVPSTMPRPANAIIGNLFPLNPSGGIVGWTCTLQLDLPWNRV